MLYYIQYLHLCISYGLCAVFPVRINTLALLPFCPNIICFLTKELAQSSALIMIHSVIPIVQEKTATSELAWGHPLEDLAGTQMSHLAWDLDYTLMTHYCFS